LVGGPSLGFGSITVKTPEEAAIRTQLQHRLHRLRRDISNCLSGYRIIFLSYLSIFDRAFHHIPIYTKTF